MRLLNVHTLEFESESRTPEKAYAIASHRWEKDEATFQDVHEKKNLSKAGYQKVKSFASYVRNNVPDIDTIWVDSCCIDKNNTAELDYSINSMFKWYRESEICLAYLSDVPSPNDEVSTRCFRETLGCSIISSDIDYLTVCCRQRSGAASGSKEDGHCKSCLPLEPLYSFPEIGMSSVIKACITLFYTQVRR